MFKAADRENRPLTADERTYAQNLLDEAEEVGRGEKQIHDIGVALGASDAFTDPNAFERGGRRSGRRVRAERGLQSDFRSDTTRPDTGPPVRSMSAGQGCR